MSGGALQSIKTFAALLFMFCWSTVWAAEAARVTVPVKPIQMGPHSYYVQGLPGSPSAENQGYMSNAGFVITRDGVVVFDALGTPPLGERLIQEIRKLTKQPIKRVIVSHYHADHIYGLQAFKAVGAEIWAHREGQQYLNSEVAEQRLAQRREALFPWVDENTKTLPADRWLDGPLSFTMGGLHFDLMHLGPAHSPEDLAMFVREDGVLYSGDVVFKGRVPFVGGADTRRWLAALDKIAAMKPKVFVPGHGEAARDALETIRFTQEYLTFVRTEMGKAVKDLVPFDEAYATTDWNRYRNLPAFDATNRANAYNIYLQMERESM